MVYFSIIILVYFSIIIYSDDQGESPPDQTEIIRLLKEKIHDQQEILTLLKEKIDVLQGGASENEADSTAAAG